MALSKIGWPETGARSDLYKGPIAIEKYSSTYACGPRLEAGRELAVGRLRELNWPGSHRPAVQQYAVSNPAIDRSMAAKNHVYAGTDKNNPGDHGEITGSGYSGKNHHDAKQHGDLIACYHFFRIGTPAAANAALIAAMV